MQVRDEAAWSAQVIALQADETTRAFLTFFEQWAKTAEELLALVDDSGNPRTFPNSAVSKALEVTEQTMDGFLSIEWIAQMLLLFVDYWTRGEELYRAMSFIEKRLVEQATAMKLADLQQSARLPTET